MKLPKTEPYQRSRHRAALHAWVVAATAVASIGMPAAATIDRDQTHQQSSHSEQTPSQQAQRIASYWIDALQLGDQDAARSLMRLPSVPANQHAVQTDLDVLSDLFAPQGVRVEPVGHRHAGHWALSAWSLEAIDIAQAPVIEPITLYHPAPDGLFDSAADWQVMPLGVEDDPAFKPLYNADHEALIDWYQTLV